MNLTQSVGVARAVHGSGHALLAKHPGLCMVSPCVAAREFVGPAGIVHGQARRARAWTPTRL